MRQILQTLKNGATILKQIPCPGLNARNLLVRSTTSLVSAGTERMLVDFGKAGWIQKARSQPEKVRQVLDKIRTDGLLPTIEAVQSKLDQPLPLGYCNVGVVIAVGDRVSGYSVGERVASNGKHAEVVCVPANLCARVPDGIDDETAAFTVIGGISLQGIRLIQPTLGEAVVVTGLGLIGLVAVQLLRAHGCRVLGIDFDSYRVELARRMGVEAVDLSKGEDPLAAASVFSRGRGVDAVLITASTKSSEPVRQAAHMCRKRGRIVLVGVTGLELSRADFYEKELSFQVSCSYGPGRYDPLYEEGGQDYPFGFVRWTEGRNFEAFLDMLAEKRIDVSPLITHRFPIDEAGKAYALLSGNSALGILLQYPRGDAQEDRRKLQRTVLLEEGALQQGHIADGVSIGVLGAGNYASRVLIPALKKTGAELKTIVSAGGVSAVHAGRKNGFEEASTESEKVFHDDKVNTVVIATRHDSHARFLCEAFKARKHVFVEKPLCLTREELDEIIRVYSAIQPPASNLDLSLPSSERERSPLISPSSSDTGSLSSVGLSPDLGPRTSHLPLLMIGFNRRFAPHTKKIKELLADVHEPKIFVMTVNAGAIPPDHWTQDQKVGGGRIIGEGCHFIDLLRFLAGTPISSVQTARLGAALGLPNLEDKATITLSFGDGSMGTIHYLANGHKSFPKERLEIFCAGRILQLDNFRSLKGYGWPKFSKMRLWRQDKGQSACVSAFVEAIRKGLPSPIPFEELIEVTRATFDICEALKQPLA